MSARRYAVIRLGARDWRVAIVTDGMRGWAPVPHERHRRRCDAYERCVDLNRGEGTPDPYDVPIIKLRQP